MPDKQLPNGHQAHELDDENRYFAVRITRDTTESATVPIKAKSRDEVMEIATTRDTGSAFGHCFSVNDGSGEEGPYLVDDEEDIEEISVDEYRKMQLFEAMPKPNLSELLETCHEVLAHAACSDAFPNDLEKQLIEAVAKVELKEPDYPIHLRTEVSPSL